MIAVAQVDLCYGLCVNRVSNRKPKPAAAPVASDAPSQADGQPGADVILVHGASEDGESLAVLRAREDRIECGIVRKVKEGESIHGELLRLTPRPESPLLCDVTVELPASASTRSESTRHLSHGGPAQVATPSYRQNWDAIWSKPKKPSAPN